MSVSSERRVRCNFISKRKSRGERLYGSKQADTTAAIAAAPLHDSGGDGWTGGPKK
jgi:hypothetical protein